METELEQLRKENAALKKALTPSGETKYVHIGEYKFTESFYQSDWESDEINIDVTVPWTTVKEIMAAIVKHSGITL